MNTVADLLAQQKAQEVVWIEPLANVYDALTLMNERNIGALLVQIDGYLVGIVSERDYVRKVILNRHEAQKLKVSEIMTREVISVTTQDTVIHCINLMKSHHFRHLPVVEAGRAIGIVSLRDLFLDVIEDSIKHPTVSNNL
ncbi:CBS domain-containing protein [bacterium]|nr:CBS domain-containing protein [Gammaproteobacteria bacterium]MCH1549563.1 CBS domain-containing protein [Pseudomonadales bacterium]MDB3937068.1 CBS domain-containing protein [bacterium]